MSLYVSVRACICSALAARFARKLPTVKAKARIVQSFTVTRGISVHGTVKVSNNFRRASSSSELHATNLRPPLFTVNNLLQPSPICHDKTVIYEKLRPILASRLHEDVSCFSSRIFFRDPANFTPPSRRGKSIFLPEDPRGKLVINTPYFPNLS